MLDKNNRESINWKICGGTKGKFLINGVDMLVGIQGKFSVLDKINIFRFGNKRQIC